MPPLILIADDKVSILELLTVVLEDAGYRVQSALDGMAALVLIDQERPALLLTDNMMPKLSGMALIAKIQERPGPTLPIILMSAVSSLPSLPPRVTFLAKPFDLDRLLELIAYRIGAK